MALVCPVCMEPPIWSTDDCLLSTRELVRIWTFWVPGSAGDAGQGHAEPGHRRGRVRHLVHGQRHVSHVLSKVGAANRTEAVAGHATLA